MRAMKQSENLDSASLQRSLHSLPHAMAHTGDNEETEGSIVSSSDAVSNPGAVVIEGEHTVVTSATMRTARRTRDMGISIVGDKKRKKRCKRISE